MRRLALLAALLAASSSACGSPRSAAPPPAQAPPDPHTIIGTLGGSLVQLSLDGDRITSVTPQAAASSGPPIWLSPPVIDSHVHLAFWSVADQLAAAGVEAVVDLAAPEATLSTASTTGIHVLAAGPMLTHVDGYPLDSWGRDGFGAGCADAACVTSTIDRLAAHGARVIKLALDDDGLAPALVPVAVAAAHAHHLRVAVHALSDASAALAAAAGVDILAHTPVEPLRDATIAAWRGRAVISTLAAFGGSASAVENLRKLRAAGVTVLYGTDLGNSRDAGPSPAELDLLAQAGLDPAAITAAMTTVPAAYWEFDVAQPPLGKLVPGAEATFVELAADPQRDPHAFLAPRAVWLRGHRVAAVAPSSSAPR